MNNLSCVSMPIKNSVEEFVNRYQKSYSKTIDSMLELSRVVAEAKSLLCKPEFSQFCSSVGLKSRSTIVKMTSIGEKYSALKEYKSKLPSNWTTVYQLSRLSSDKIDELLSTNEINPKTLGKSLIDIVPELGFAQGNNKSSASKQISTSFKVEVEYSDWDIEDKERLLLILKDLNSLGCQLRVIKGSFPFVEIYQHDYLIAA